MLVWLKNPVTSFWSLDLVLPATGDSLGVSFFPTALTTGVEKPPPTLPFPVCHQIVGFNNSLGVFIPSTQECRKYTTDPRK